MALLKCPDCGKDVSDKAAACPNCGCPVDAIIEHENRDAEHTLADILAMSEEQKAAAKASIDAEIALEKKWQEEIKEALAIEEKGKLEELTKQLDAVTSSDAPERNAPKRKNKGCLIFVLLIVVGIIIYVGIGVYNSQKRKEAHISIMQSMILAKLDKYDIKNLTTNILTTNKTDKGILYTCSVSCDEFEILSDYDKCYWLLIYDTGVDYSKEYGLFEYRIDYVESNGNKYKYKSYPTAGLYKNDEFIFENEQAKKSSESSDSVGSARIGRSYSSAGVSSSDKTYAYIAAQMAVEEQLKSPSTAKFPWPDEITVEKDGNYFRIKGYVDAQNSFGATVRNDFTVEIEKVSEEKFNIVSVTLY